MLPGRVSILRNTCLLQPGLAAPPNRARNGANSWSCSPFLGSPGVFSSLSPSFLLDRSRSVSAAKKLECLEKSGDLLERIRFGNLTSQPLISSVAGTRFFTSRSSFNSSVKQCRC